MAAIPVSLRRHLDLRDMRPAGGSRRAPGALFGSLATALAGQLVLVASGVLIARALGVEGRGALALIMLVPSAVSALGTTGLPLALTYEVARDSRRSPLLTRALTLRIVLQAVVLSALTAAALFALVEEGERGAVGVALAIVPALVVQQYGLAILQGTRRFGPFNCARLAPAALYALGLVALVLAHRATLLPVVLVWTAVNVLIAVPLGVVVTRHARSAATGARYDLRATNRFALRAVAGSSAPGEALRVDQVVAACLLPRAALGLYVVALAFTNLPRFISQSLGMVALPARAVGALADTKRLQRLFLVVLAGTAGTVVLALELTMGQLVPLLFGHEFDGAVTAARILLAGTLLLAFRRVLADLAQGAGRPGAGAVAEGTYLAVALPAACLGAAFFGITGVAGAVTVAAAASLVVVVAAARTRQRVQSSAGQSDAVAAEASVVTQA